MDQKSARFKIEEERKQRRAHQTRKFKRNQAIGILVLAAAVLVYRLLRTPSGWIFPAGWWRLW